MSDIFVLQLCYISINRIYARNFQRNNEFGKTDGDPRIQYFNKQNTHLQGYGRIGIIITPQQHI